MMGKRSILVLVLLLLLPLAHAAPAGGSSMDFEIWPDGTSEVRAQFVIDSRGVGTLSIPAENAQFVSINDDQSALRFAALDEGLLIGPSREDEGYSLELRYQTTALTSKRGDEWVWNIDLHGEFWRGLGTLAVVVKVPEQAMLISYTEGGMVYSNGGLHLGWRLQNPLSVDSLEVKYRLEPAAFFPAGPGESRKSVLLLILGIIIGGVLLWFVYDRLLRKVSSGKRDILAALDRRERRIMEHLIENGKEMTQTQVAKQTGLSKATVSRAIKRLREKGLLTARNLGTATIISISTKFSKK